VSSARIGATKYSGYGTVSTPSLSSDAGGPLARLPCR
jgi:hypothetical protein